MGQLGALKRESFQQSFKLGLKETNPPTGDTQHREHGVVPHMAGQIPVVVVSPRLSWQPRCTEKGGVPLGVRFSPSSSALSPPISPLTSCHLQPLIVVLSCATAFIPASIVSSIPTFSSAVPSSPRDGLMKARDRWWRRRGPEWPNIPRCGYVEKSEEEMTTMWWTEGASHRPFGRVGTSSNRRRRRRQAFAQTLVGPPQLSLF